MKFVITRLIIAAGFTVLPLPGVAKTPSPVSKPAPAVSPAQSEQTNASIPWNQIGAKAGADYKGDGLAALPTGTGVRLNCLFQKLDGEATREGLWLTSTVTSAVSDRFQIKAAAAGRRPDLAETSRCHVPACSASGEPQASLAAKRAVSTNFLTTTGVISIDGQTVRFNRPGLVEEYTLSMDGIRQDFVVLERPPGAGELRVGLTVEGATAEPAADGAKLELNRSGRRIAYSRLHVVDAAGRELSARMEAALGIRSAATTLAVLVNDTDAVYPVRIDPTFSDANWTSIGSLPGANGPVHAAVVDGSGNLYIGGKFTMVGGIVANHIAKWDGTSWSALGPGIIDGYVWALVVLGSDVYAGGDFLSAGGNAANWIEKWNGSSWSALGSGVDGPVEALTVSGSDLYAGGYFTTAGGSAANHVAKWNGSGWSALGSGMNQSVYALAVSGSDLYAGGLFTMDGSGAIRVAKWNGSSWSALGSGMNGAVFALAVSGSDLYAGGDFTTVGGSAAKYIAKWNGSSWSPLGSGVNNTVFALAVSGSDLYAGGWFTTAGGSAANYIAKWNGSSWSALGSGMNNRVNALAVAGSDLYAGGDFTAAGGKSSLRAARASLLSTPPLPSLNIQLTAPNTVRISWPSPSTGFVLQQNTTGLSPAGWSSVTGTIQDDGTNRILLVNPTGPRGFFRLIRP